MKEIKHQAEWRQFLLYSFSNTFCTDKIGFMQILREEFDRESRETGNPRLLLTAAVSAGDTAITAYEIDKISR